MEQQKLEVVDLPPEKEGHVVYVRGWPPGRGHFTAIMLLPESSKVPDGYKLLTPEMIDNDHYLAWAARGESMPNIWIMDRKTGKFAY